jgi:hypothetical protein
MLGMLPVLGVHAFEQGGQQSKSASPTESLLTCRGKGVAASGFESTQGFVVKAGSHAVLNEVPSLEQHVPGVHSQRQDLIVFGILKLDGNRYTFAQDYVFNSPSMAAAVILGRSANGRIEWKDASGRTLKTLQEMEASV